MKISITKILFLIISLGFIKINAQSKLENDFYKSLNSLNVKDHQIDSLKTVLSQKINQINKEKTKAPSNKSVIEKLLAGTSNITNNIERLENEKVNLENQIANRKKELGNYYSLQIDSLKKSSADKNFLKILELSEKRLLVAENIEPFSFDPQKIEYIKSVHDSKKREIYTEFLVSVKDEVEKKLLEVGNLKSEIDNVIKLNEEKEAFLDDISFNSRTMKSSNSKTAANAEANYGNETSASKDLITNYSSALNGILNQLEFNKINDSKSVSAQKYIGRSDNAASMKELLKLIEQAEKELTEYKNAVNAKLKKL